MQLTREQLVRNETDFFVYNKMTDMMDIFKACFKIDEDIRRIKQNYPITLAKAQQFISDLDSSKYCAIMMPQLGLDVSACQ